MSAPLTMLGDLLRALQCADRMLAGNTIEGDEFVGGVRIGQPFVAHIGYVVAQLDALAQLSSPPESATTQGSNRATRVLTALELYLRDGAERPRSVPTAIPRPRRSR